MKLIKKQSTAQAKSHFCAVQPNLCIPAPERLNLRNYIIVCPKIAQRRQRLQITEFRKAQNSREIRELQ
jgi:hypothetical protein